jgi:hypothetical protein
VLAGDERAGVVVEAGRLADEDLGRGTLVLDRERDAGDQAAARGAAQHGVELGAHRLRLQRELEPDRALPGDHVGVVVGRHQRHAALVADLPADRRAVLAEAVVGLDLGAVGAGVADLDRRRVGRHHDHRRHAEQLRGVRDALRVVAGGVGDDAAALLVGGEPADAVVGAAELERAGALQRLGLGEQAEAEPLVEQRGFEQRRHHRLAGDLARGVLHPGDVGQRRGVSGGGGGIHRGPRGRRVRRASARGRRRAGPR